MTERLGLYKCGDCGDIVEIVQAGTCEPNCCDAPMERLAEKHEETGFEKHVPVIEKTGDGVNVKVGSVPHPMEAEHYIAWVEIVSNGEVRRRFLKPGEAPEAAFGAVGDGAVAREYCTVHGLWIS